ncbi:hypothetical protein jhhlp_002687 [Lomentospora prolificans]|uniref:Rhodopsin domain-containing protein n=1 Tax=Lomentospora prolificans TaxID=41688 RepID=A0A2N3NER5_9PEZI|nr:hypothetical protein jhhlp_002687 [Lomentospora prolificans]
MERPEGFDPANDNESQVPTVITVAVTFATLSTVFTSLRVFTRARLLRMMCADDWAIVFAQLISIIVSVLTVIETQYALGRHMWAVPPEDVLMQIKILYGVILGYNFGLNVVKISFLLFYLRIFQSTILRSISKWFLIAVGAWTITQIILLAITCMPITFIVLSMEGKCLDTYPVWLLSSVTSTVTDVVIFALPLHTVIKLKLRPKQKILTVLMFSLGFFTCIISVLRILTLSASVNAADPTWDNVGTGCWSIIELNCAILCSNFPTLRPLVVKYFPSFGLSSAGASSHGYGHYRRYGRDGEYIRHKSTNGTVVGNDMPNARFTKIEETTLEAGGDSRGDSTEHLKVVATTCYSGLKDREDIELVNQPRAPPARGHRGVILVTRETNVVTGPAPARMHGRNMSLGGERCVDGG